jgi:hypothetical protein
MKNIRRMFAVFFALLVIGQAHAFKLSPTGTSLDRYRAYMNSGFIEWMEQKLALRGVHQFTEPVHEEITHRIYDCDADQKICGNAEVEYAPYAVLAGVRWNDDPPFRLNSTGISECKVDETIRVITQPVCWARLFKYAESKARNETYDAEHSAGNLMYRSHFGDLQFIHAMASTDGEAATETQKRMMMWAEFTWRVALGEYSHGTLLRTVTVPGFNKFFGNVGWNVQDLFTLGNPPLRKHIGDVAFGSLLHMVEDSFARGHVSRAEGVYGEVCPGGKAGKPGVIREFRSYQNQDHYKHAEFDSRLALADHLVERPSVVGIGRDLRNMYEQHASWENVKPYLACAFAIEDGNVKASAGNGMHAAR